MILAPQEQVTGMDFKSAKSLQLVNFTLSIHGLESTLEAILFCQAKELKSNLEANQMISMKPPLREPFKFCGDSILSLAISLKKI